MISTLQQEKAVDLESEGKIGGNPDRREWIEMRMEVGAPMNTE